MLGIVRETCSCALAISVFWELLPTFIAEQQRILSTAEITDPEWCCGSRSARGPDVQGHEGILDLRVRCQRAQYSFSKRRAWRLYKLSVAGKVLGVCARGESLSASANPIRQNVQLKLPKHRPTC